jgi:hypothetical protein
MDAGHLVPFRSFGATVTLLVGEAAAIVERAPGPEPRKRAARRALAIARDASRDLDACASPGEAYRLCLSALCAASVALAEARNAMACPAGAEGGCVESAG